MASGLEDFRQRIRTKAGRERADEVNKKKIKKEKNKDKSAKKMLNQ